MTAHRKPRRRSAKLGMVGLVVLMVLSAASFTTGHLVVGFCCLSSGLAWISVHANRSKSHGDQQHTTGSR